MKRENLNKIKRKFYEKYQKLIVNLNKENFYD